MRDGDETVLLQGGSTPGVVRIGRHVHRPCGPKAPFVHAFLRHLERVGFAAAPRLRGIDDQGREILTYLPGTVPRATDGARWTDDQLHAVATLLRRYHDATARTPLAADQEVVCHNDAAPWNTVFDGETPVALIDFDDAAPGPRIRDIAYAVWCWLNLGDERFSPAEQARRLGLFCDAYGLTERKSLLDAILTRHGEIHAMRVAKGHHALAARVAVERAWVQRHDRPLQSLADGRVN